MLCGLKGPFDQATRAANSDMAVFALRIPLDVLVTKLVYRVWIADFYHQR